MYASSRRGVHGSRPATCLAALRPATSPWAAASSYPVVPLIWPAKMSPSTALVSRDGRRSRGSK